MSDFGAELIAKALRFFGLCLFYGMVVKHSANPQKSVDIVEREYNK